MIRAGIPRYLRGQAWYEYSGALEHHRQHPDVFPQLLAVIEEQEKEDGRGSPQCLEEHCLEAIERGTYISLIR